MSWGRYFELYAEQCLLRGYSEHTMKTNRKYMHQFMKHLALQGFRGNEIEVGKSEYEAYSIWVNEQDFAQNAKRGRILPLFSFYKAALKNRWMASSPVEGFKVPRKEIVEPKVLTVAEMKGLLDGVDISTMKGIRDRMTMELLYSTGLRAKEIVSVRPDDFGEDYRTVRVTGKGQKEAVLPVGRMAAHFTRFYVNEIWKPRHGTDKLLLNTNTFEAITNEGLRNILMKIGRNAKLRIGLSAHVFRYSVATHLSENGADLRLVQGFMRHDCISTTARYIGIGLEELRAIHSKTHPREI